MKRFLVGLGNWTMGDDSIGLRIVTEIVDRKLEKNFEAVALPDSGFNLIDCFNGDTEKIMIIDTVRAGKKPGEYFFFRPDEVETHRELEGISSHEGDILKVIRLAKELGYPIPEITIIGIEPGKIEPGELSRPLQERFELYVDTAITLIGGHP